MNRNQIYDIHTVEDLDAWVSRNNLSYDTDTELSLRKMTLLAEELLRKDNRCSVCNKQYSKRSHMLRHERTVHGNTDINCSVCKRKFSRQDHLNRHMISHKENKAPSTYSATEGTCQRPLDFVPTTSNANECASTQTQQLVPAKCIWCSQMKELLPAKKFCKECSENGRECKWCHRPLPERHYSKRLEVCDSCVNRREKYLHRQQIGGSRTSALQNTAQTETLEPNSGNMYDILQFFKDNEGPISNILSNRMLSAKGMKWFLILFVRFVKYNANNEPIYTEPVFRSSTFGMTNFSQFDDQIAEAFRNLHNSYQNFERDGSGWTIDRIIKMEISTVDYLPLEGSTYIPLPKKLQNKKAIINVQNSDQRCFIYSVLAAIHPVQDNPQRVSHYTPFENDLDLSGIQFPVPISQIQRFERQNNISINVFGYENEQIFPLQITDLRNMSRHVNLLLFSKGEVRHFCLIQNLNRLLGDRTRHTNQTFYCNYCLHGYSNESLLSEHIPYCSPHGPQKLSFPKSEEKQWVEFNSIQKQLKVGFVIYFDFESFIQPISSCDPNPEKSSTTAYQKHEPCGFSYMVKCSHDEFSKPAQVYRGPHVVDTFFEKLLEEEKYICDILSKVKPIVLTDAQEKSFQEAVDCHICLHPLGVDRVRDHCHLSGIYRGAAHSNCNLQYQFRKFKNSKSPSNFYIPAIAHNLRGYDMHHLMISAGKFKSEPISCIPNNMEKYISFSLGNLRFIDSLQFLNAPLDTLTANLAKEGIKKFENVVKQFPNPKQQELLLRKGVFPYDALTSSTIFDLDSLPPKDHFYNKLTDSDVSEEDYEHAQAVWRGFNIKNFGEFHDLYVLSDCLILADVFENFRSLCLEFYKLDPAQYFTSPGLAFESMLKMTGVRLQLFNDIDMFLMTEASIRGGVSIITKKYAKANNPRVPGYDASKPNTWITYLDMNNLYGTAMCQPLPEKDFEWLTQEQINQLDIMSISDTSDTGYILEVDLEYDQNLHSLHSDYPLAPQLLEITDDMLSPYTMKLKKTFGIKERCSKKLVPNLYSKTHYCTHYRNLKYYMANGLRLTKIHRAFSFTQSTWLKKYIDFNTKRRMLAKNAFEKDFFKLMNNAVFGKLMENMRKRIHVELVNTPKRLRKVCAKPNFQSFKIFNEDLVAVNLKKTNIVLNRPIYAGFCVLDLSKIFMYQFHYGFMKQTYADKAELLFSDTDSLTYEIQTRDWYADMLENQDLFDTSNFPKDDPLYSQTNCKQLGKMKDECNGKPVESFVGLRPKMYSIMCGGVQKKTAKGVKKYVVEKQLKHALYEQSLFENSVLRHKMNVIRSFDHQLYSVTVSKTTLSPYDNKRYVTDSGIYTLALGHYKAKS